MKGGNSNLVRIWSDFLILKFDISHPFSTLSHKLYNFRFYIFNLTIWKRFFLSKTTNFHLEQKGMILHSAKQVKATNLQFRKFQPFLHLCHHNITWLENGLLMERNWNFRLIWILNFGRKLCWRKTYKPATVATEINENLVCYSVRLRKSNIHMQKAWAFDNRWFCEEKILRIFCPYFYGEDILRGGFQNDARRKNSLKLHSDPIKSITLNTMTRFKSEVNAWVGRCGRSSPVRGLNFDIFSWKLQY